MDLLPGFLAAAGAFLITAHVQAEEPIEQFENGLHEQPVMSVTHIFRYGEEQLRLEDRMRLYNVPGLALTVIDDYGLAWSGQWGVRDADSGEKVAPDTVFEAGSASKLVTAVVAMKLVEEGIIALDEPVNNRLEAWQIPVNDFTRESPVTLRQLLSHTSGINRPDSMLFFEDNSSPTLLDVLNGELPSINDPVTVESVPGEQHRYSNLAYNVIQLLLEEATGKAFSTVMQEYLFDPLGMDSCTYQFPLTAKTAARMAFPHDGDRVPHPNDLHPAALAHGGLICTPADMAKLTVALMAVEQGSGLLAPETFREMRTGQHEVQDEVGGFNGQGLGVFILSDDETAWLAHHGYNTPGTCTLVFMNPASGDGLVVMANGKNGFQLIMEVLAGLADQYDWPAVSLPGSG